MVKKLLLYGNFASISLGLSGCYTVPDTGRSALCLFSEEKLAMTSAMEFAKIKSEKPISNNPDYNERVQRVGKRIADAAKEDIPNVNWEFVVFDDDQINAFAMPGGKVAVYTGLLKYAQTDDELAIVIGHEIAHVAARHSNERISQQVVKSGLISIVDIALGAAGLDYAESGILLSAVGAGAEFGVMLPFSREHENEADHIGLIYAAAAGYHPHAAITFWERIEALDEREGTLEFISTHPAGKTRIRKLWVQMPEALEVYKNR